MKNKTVLYVLVLCIPLIFSPYCESIPVPYDDLQYSTGGAMPNAVRSSLRVAVTPFEEPAPLKTIDDAIRTYETGPGRERFAYRFSRWLTDELRSAGIFNSVEFREWGVVGREIKSHDLVITGTISDYDFDETICWPNLIIPCACLTLINLLPFSYESHKIQLDMKVLDPKNPDRVLWKKTYEIKDPDMGFRFLYTGNSKYKYDEVLLRNQIKILRPIFRESISEIYKQIKPGGLIYTNLRAGR